MTPLSLPILPMRRQGAGSGGRHGTSLRRSKFATCVAVGLETFQPSSSVSISIGFYPTHVDWNPTWLIGTNRPIPPSSCSVIGCTNRQSGRCTRIHGWRNRSDVVHRCGWEVRTESTRRWKTMKEEMHETRAMLRSKCTPMDCSKGWVERRAEDRNCVELVRLRETYSARRTEPLKHKHSA